MESPGDPGGKSSPGIPNNLPEQLTSFVGRDKQVAEIKVLLTKSRLITVTGMGGSGKTRLALKVADDALGEFPDGVWLIDLASLSDPALVLPTVAGVLGIKEEAGKTIQQSLVNWISAKRLLLILDNCEHLISPCASLAAELLRSCSQVHILATSRERLNVGGEQSYPVPSLSIPNLKNIQTAEDLYQFEAVRLFIERAKAVQPSFSITKENAPAVAQVCVRLDGIPLAIELAAARVRSMSVEVINARLDQRFHLLKGGSRTALPRQQTLRAMIDWSYDLLTDQEKALLSRLSVFAGGWTVEAAETVCAGEPVEELDVLDLLTSLVDKSLAVYEAGAGNADRYRLLETVREYAADRLKEGPDQATIRDGHLKWCLQLAEQADANLVGPDYLHWLDRLEAEHDNMRAALSLCENEPENVASSLILIGDLAPFWTVRGYLFEARRWFSIILGLPDACQPSVSRARALAWAGNLSHARGEFVQARDFYADALAASIQIEDQKGIAVARSGLALVFRGEGDYIAAQDQFEQSLIIFQQIEDQHGIAYCFHGLGNIASDLGELKVSHEQYEKSLQIRRIIQDIRSVAYSLNGLANVAYDQGELVEARKWYEESLLTFREAGDVRSIAYSLNGLANVAYSLKDYLVAQHYYEESLAIRQKSGDIKGIPFSLKGLANVAYKLGDYTRAWDLFENNLTHYLDREDQRGIAESIGNLARVCQGKGQLLQAAQLWGSVSRLREDIGKPLPSSEQEETDKDFVRLREEMDNEAFLQSWEAGRSRSLDQMVQYVLANRE